MKKIITLLLISTIGYAQTDYIKVLSVTDTVTTGDSIVIKFTKVNNNGSNHMSRLQLWTSTYLQDCMYISSSFLTDTNTIKVAITPSMGIGDARIYSNVGPYTPFYIKPIVGMQEFSKREVVSVQHFDIYGKEKPSTDRSEDLTIRITTYSNGYQKKEKVLFELNY